MNPEYFKAVAGIFTGFLAYVGNSVAQIAAPDQSWSLWLDKYGLPMTFLGLSLYVVVVLYKALRESEKARISDKEASLTLYRQDFAAAQTTRNEMITETRETKEALREFAETMKTRPCGLPKTT